MAAKEEDVAALIERIRADIAGLSETVSQLVTDTSGIQATLRKRVNSAAKGAAKAGGDLLGEATAIGEEAIDAAAKSATAAVSTIESEIARNPLTSVLIALGFGFAVGLLTRK